MANVPEKRHLYLEKMSFLRERDDFVSSEEKKYLS